MGRVQTINLVATDIADVPRIDWPHGLDLFDDQPWRVVFNPEEREIKPGRLEVGDEEFLVMESQDGERFEGRARVKARDSRLIVLEGVEELRRL